MSEQVSKKFTHSKSHKSNTRLKSQQIIKIYILIYLTLNNDSYE